MIKLNGKMCGTCIFWERDFATDSKIGGVWANAGCPCKVEIKFPSKMPFSIQKVSTLCEDGVGCIAWKKKEGDIFMIDAAF